MGELVFERGLYADSIAGPPVCRAPDLVQQL